MDVQEKVQKVQAMYAAFGQGDIESILRAVTDDVEWHLHGPREIPWAGARRGREQARQFFADHNSSVEMRAFEPQRYIAQGDDVVVLGREAARVLATGKEYDSPWAMVFTFRGDQVARWECYADSAALADACRR